MAAAVGVTGPSASAAGTCRAPACAPGPCHRPDPRWLRQSLALAASIWMVGAVFRELGCPDSTGIRNCVQAFETKNINTGLGSRQNISKFFCRSELERGLGLSATVSRGPKGCTVPSMIKNHALVVKPRHNLETNSDCSGPVMSSWKGLLLPNFLFQGVFRLSPC